MMATGPPAPPDIHRRHADELAELQGECDRLGRALRRAMGELERLRSALRAARQEDVAASCRADGGSGSLTPPPLRRQTPRAEPTGLDGASSSCGSVEEGEDAT